MNKTIRIAFFDTKPYDREYFLKAAERPEFAGMNFTFDFFEAHLTDATASLASGHDVVCIFVNDHVDRVVADQLAKSGIQLVALRCAGYNNVDLESVWQRIHVVRVPAYSPHAVAEHAVALLQTLNRRVHTAYNRTRDGNFALTGLVGRDLYEKTAGIIGTGRIGKILATILSGYGMHILLNDLHPDTAFAESIGARYVERDELYRNSDVISLHCPLTPENYHMINAEVLAKMKSGVILINTGRGALIDTKALVDALKDEKIRGAGLDVYEDDPRPYPGLEAMDNVVLAPHIGSGTHATRHAMADWVLENIRTWPPVVRSRKSHGQLHIGQASSTP